jgi:hypothetical protein
MQSGYYYSHCPECGLPASGGFTCGHTPKVASATSLNTKTVEDGMSDEQDFEHEDDCPCEEVADWFVASCSCGWTYQHPNYGTSQDTFVNHWGDHILATRSKLPKPEDGIEAQQGACSCGYPIVGCDVDDGGERREDCKRAINLELKGEGGALESTEELPPLDDQAEARMKVMNDHPSFPSEAWEILAHCRERQLKQCMSQKNQLIHTVADLSGKIAKLSFESLSADVPVEERTLSVEVREQLWASHGCAGIYGDDGEMQCAFRQPFIDFKRDSEEKILEGCRIHAMERLKLAMSPERTAEMERLFKKVIMATYDLWDSDQDSKVGKRLRALAGLLPGYDRDIDTLLDHIEGKAKC